MTSIDGIEVEIIKKRVKCARLRVRKDCSVALTIPYGFKTEDAMKFVIKNKKWIEEQQEKMNSKIIRYEDGETIHILGNPAILHIGYGDHCSCRFDAEKVTMTVDKDVPAVKERTLRSLYFEILARYLDIFVPKWESITGNYCSSYGMKYYKSRWGVCNTENRRICFNIALATKPAGCIEYVVLHEIMHLKVPNHGSEFKKSMSEYMPDWKIRKRMLKD